jgi:anaerobic magnesium-protoporphyrin IX monomethyl ester cyclase
MKILLTHAYYLNQDKNELRILKPYPPLGLLCISAYLKKFGFDVEVYDSTFKSFQHQKNAILRCNPDIVGIYCNLMTKLNVIPLIKFIKQNTLAKVVLGGPEPPFYAEEFLGIGADIIVEGEGEVTMKEILTEPLISRIKMISGIIYRDDKGMTLRNSPRALSNNIDEFGMPDRETIDIREYLNAWKRAHGYSSVSINTMRGCPYTCKWCSHSVYGMTYRRKSPEKTADEIDYVMQTYSPDMLWFVDDVFTISHKWLSRTAKILKDRNLKIKFECITRSDRMNEDIVKTLKEMGCFRVWIGAESGSQKVLDLMDRRVEAGQVRDMIKLAKKYGIETGTFIMLGYPGETNEDIKETVAHLKQANPDLFLTTVAYPIKGTPFYNEVESNLVTDLPWEKRTDRDLDFKGRYSKRFYRFANRYLVNEVNLHKMKLNGNGGFFGRGKTFLKAKAAKAMMELIN